MKLRGLRHVSLRPLARLGGAVAFVALSACGGPGFDKPVRLGDRMVEPAVLNRGRDLFNRFCATCHGYDGKADTAQARQLDPHPRDFTIGEFKRVASPGALPTDQELSTVIQHGIPPVMPAWPQIEGKDLDAVVQYLKTFSQRWNTSATPAPKKSEGGAMNVLPGGNDAASFRAAYGAVGHEPRNAGGTARTSAPRDVDGATLALVSEGSIAGDLAFAGQPQLPLRGQPDDGSRNSPARTATVPPPQRFQPPQTSR